MLDLQDETAGLAAEGLAQVVEVEVNLLAALQQVIEVVGHHRLALGIAWQSTFTADVVGDEAALRLVGGQDTLVGAEQVQTLKVEAAGLQQAHNL